MGERREMRRWLISLAVPVLLASVSLAVALATAGGAVWTDWFFLPGVVLAPTWIAVLARLALASDTNAQAEVVHLSQPRKSHGRKAA